MKCKGAFIMYGLTPFGRMNIFDAVNDFDKDFYDGSKKIAACRTDIIEDDDKFITESELPGFDKKDIAIDIDGQSLTIKAVHSEKKDEQQKSRYIHRERTFSSYQRSFDISGIDTENISAEYKDGILTVTLPKKKASTPPTRRLEIN
jgi:HSP20 family protein